MLPYAILAESISSAWHITNGRFDCLPLLPRRQLGLPRPGWFYDLDPGGLQSVGTRLHQSLWHASRFDMEVSKLPSGPGQWDFTLDWEGQTTPYYYTSLCNGQSRLPYGKAKRTVVKATLWHFDTLDERVTFHNLDLLPLVEDAGTKFGVTPRFLVLKYAVSATCPSGVQITLPAQNVQKFDAIFSCYNGNANALFIKVETTPPQREAVLPLSPLYREYKKPVTIHLDCDPPNLMVFYQADNTYNIIAVGLPNFKMVQHLDSLTLVVRQRVSLKRIPIALNLPVFRPL